MVESGIDFFWRKIKFEFVEKLPWPFKLNVEKVINIQIMEVGP